MDKQNLPKVLLSLLDTASEGLWFMSDDNQVQFYNITFYEQFNLPPNSSTLDDWLALVHPVDRQRLARKVNLHQKDNVSKSIKTRYRIKNLLGQYLWIEATGVRVEHEGKFAMVGSHKDVSEEVLLNQYLTHIAKHDSETGLFNRHQFLQVAPSLNEKSWLILCRLNQLQQYQRRIGESAIGQLSSTLVSILDEILDLDYGLYRISAEVFVVTIDKALVEKTMCSIINKITSQFHEGKPYKTSFSNRLGLVALMGSDINKSNILEQLFNLAEYTQTNSNPTIYTTDLQRKIDRNFAIQDALENAIETEQVTIDLQPIIGSKSNEVISFEALARWTHPIFGPISPTEFIPLAERQGHIHALGMEVIKKSCKFLLSFDQVNESKPFINVNVSAYQLLNDMFITDILRVVDEFGVATYRIILEVTESYLIDEDHTIGNTLKNLHDHGFKISIDDFGSGMSSITSLFKLPLYQIKLDRELINEAMEVNSCLKLISHICEFGRIHEISIVAEGVETTDIRRKLVEIGIPYLQGYAIHIPNEPHKWLRNNALTLLAS